MRKGTGKYLKQEVMITVCDHCGKELGPEYISYDYNWSDGHDTFGDVTEVCSLDCLLFIIGDKKYESYFFPIGEDVRLFMPAQLMKKLLLGG